MLKRKATAAKSTPPPRSGSPKAPKLKAPPVRRRFVISSKAVKMDGTEAESTASAKTAGPKAPANGQTTPPAATGISPSVDLTETIKTLLHLSLVRHGSQHKFNKEDRSNKARVDEALSRR